MRKAILPLLIIITIVLSASIASATDFSAPAGSVGGSGWTTEGDWQTDDHSSWTDSTGTASHPVETGASGAFDLNVGFMFGDASNYVKIGLQTAGGVEKAIEYHDGKFWFNGDPLTSNIGDSGSNHNARIYSEDGIVWKAQIYGYNAEVNVGAVPTKIKLALGCGGSASRSPFIFGVNFASAGAPAGQDPTPTPTASPTPTPTEQPAASGSSEPMYDPQKVQDFYDNIYPLLLSPYDTVTFNNDGSYVITPGYPTSSTYHVSGTVTSAADGSPISGASVVLGEAMQKTGDDGKFRFNGIANGAADVAVSADGFASKTQSIDVKADTAIDFALDKVATGGSTIASAQNESGNMTMDTNATVEPTMAPTEAPTATQTQSPGFEGIVAAIAMIGAAGVLVYLNRKR